MSAAELPAPPVSPEVDCQNLDGFMLNVERLMASELWAISTGEEFKAAVALWSRAWKQVPAASLPDDERVLAAFAGLPPPRFRKLRAVAMRGFVKCSDGRWYHPVLAADAVRAWKAKEQRRRAIEERWKKRPNEQEQSDRNTGERSDVPTEPIRPYYGTDTIDRTGTGQGRDGTHESRVSVSGTPVPFPRQPASQNFTKAEPWSDAWEPSDADIVAALADRPDLDRETVRRRTLEFKHHNGARPNGASMNWTREWRKWVVQTRAVPEAQTSPKRTQPDWN